MIRVDVKDINGNITNSAQFADVDSANAWIAQCQLDGGFPENAAVSQTDITAMVAAEQLVQDSARALNCGRAVLAQFRALNEQKALSVQQLQALFADQSMISILFMLLTGSIQLARAAILASTNATYTDADKAQLVSIIDQYGTI